jgi:hypothetical protein
VYLKFKFGYVIKERVVGMVMVIKEEIRREKIRVKWSLKGNHNLPFIIIKIR